MKKTPARREPDPASGEQESRSLGDLSEGANELDFEAALARLEEIVERLDDGNLPLAESLALFKEGTQLAKVCRRLLSDAELHVQAALKDVQPDAEVGVADATTAHDNDFGNRDK